MERRRDIFEGQKEVASKFLSNFKGSTGLGFSAG